MRTRDLHRTARDFRAGMLGDASSEDMCAVVNGALASYLRAVCGVACRTEEVWFDETPQGTTNHIWIRLVDGRILDATADQFGLAPIYIGPVPALYRQFMEAAG